MKQFTVTIGATLNPDPLAISAGDIVVWANSTTQVQTAASDDGGQTFTTGPVQAGANSLPITVPASTPYTVLPAALHGSISLTAAASPALRGARRGSGK